MKKIVFAALPAFVVGIAIGFAGAMQMTNDDQAPDAELKSECKAEKVKSADEKKSKAENRKPSDRRTGRRQNNRVSENRDDAADENSDRPRRGNGNRDLNLRDRSERMRAENPEGYAARTNMMARWRDSRVQQVSSKLEFLAQIDTSTMSTTEKETHIKLQNLIEEREALQSKLENSFVSGDMSEEDRRAVVEALGDANAEISELNKQERENLIKKTAEAAGFTGEDVGEIAGTIMKVIEVTEDDRWGRRWGRGGRGGRR